MNRLTIFSAVALAIVVSSSIPASAQEVPTTAQKHALRSACPADFRAHCAGVPTGGMAALVCLEQNVASLSPACQSAVKAVSGGSEEPKKPATAEAKKPAVPTTTASKKPSEKKSMAAPAPAPMASGRPILPFFHELRITAHSCARDFRVLCPNVPLGHGNAIFCLKVHGDRLSERCRAALLAAGERL